MHLHLSKHIWRYHAELIEKNAKRKSFVELIVHVMIL